MQESPKIRTSELSASEQESYLFRVLGPSSVLTAAILSPPAISTFAAATAVISSTFNNTSVVCLGYDSIRSRRIHSCTNTYRGTSMGLSAGLPVPMYVPT